MKRLELPAARGLRVRLSDSVIGMQNPHMIFLIVFLQRLAPVHFNWHSPSNGLLRAGKYRLFSSTNARGSHGVKCCRRGK